MWRFYIIVQSSPCNFILEGVNKALMGLVQGKKNVQFSLSDVPVYVYISLTVKQCRILTLCVNTPLVQCYLMIFLVEVTVYSHIRLKSPIPPHVKVYSHIRFKSSLPSQPFQGLFTHTVEAYNEFGQVCVYVCCTHLLLSQVTVCLHIRVNYLKVYSHIWFTFLLTMPTLV